MPRLKNRNPLAQRALQEMKMEVAQELGLFERREGDGEREYQEALDKMKFQVAEELGIDLKQGYNGDLTSKEAGAIGGHLGGKIGGEMVRRMIRQAQEEMARDEE